MSEASKHSVGDEAHKHLGSDEPDFEAHKHLGSDEPDFEAHKHLGSDEAHKHLE